MTTTNPPPERLTAEQVAELRNRLPFITEKGMEIISLTVNERDALLADRNALEAELQEAREQIPLAAFAAHQIDSQTAQAIATQAVNDFREQLVAAVRALEFYDDEDPQANIVTFIESFNPKGE